MAPSGLIAILFLFFYLTMLTISIWAAVRIISKAGYSGWFVLLTFVPLVNIVMYLLFAFSKWPIEQRLEAAERAARGGPLGPFGWGPGRGWGPAGPDAPGPQGEPGVWGTPPAASRGDSRNLRGWDLMPKL